jgi:2-polyprenyl-6-methoxyphenol hydroxylase-like FAD-dependent oxidoreductase
LANVGFREAVDVLGLAAGAGGAVSGVSLRSRDGGGAELLPADLVVDASGRGSHAPQWLRALGYDAPEETVVNAGLAYASRVYRVPSGRRFPWQALYLQSRAPGERRGGLVLPIEGGRWVVTLTGLGGEHPPTDDAGFLEYARGLRSPHLYEAIRGAEPLSPISGHRSTANRLRHFERLARWPERFVVLGDAACAFNPVYGQGMTTAALGAELLDGCLRPGRLAGLGRRFQRELARVNRVPWLLATGEDHRYPTTTGGSPGWATRWQHRYVDQVMRLSTEDPGVRLRVLEVLHLLRLPSALFTPGLALARTAGFLSAGGRVCSRGHPPGTG